MAGALAVSTLVGSTPATAAPASPDTLTAPAADSALEPADLAADPATRLEQLDRHAIALTEDFNAARERLTSIEIKARAVQVRLDQQEAAIAATKQQLAVVASQVYRAGQTSTLDVLLSDDPDDVLTRAGLGTSVLDRQDDLVASLERKQADLLADRERVAAEKAAAQALRASLESRKAEIEKAVEQSRVQAAQVQAAQVRAEQARQTDRAGRTVVREALTTDTAITRADANGTGDPTGATARDAGEADKSGRRVVTTPKPPTTTGGGSSTTVNCGGMSVKAPSSRAAAALEFACDQLGERYVYGADGPDAWDCSGLTSGAWRKGGVSLPHSSRLQYGYGTKVSRSNLQPGDLVFFYSPISHVAMYVGDGKMIEAPNSNSRVRIMTMYGGYSGAVRL